MRITPTRTLLLAAALMAGCASAPSASIEDKFDAQTGLTLSRASQPLIFYKDSSARAAHARDFVYMGPLQVNRMGSYRYYLWLGIWSTLPISDAAEQRDGFESITLFADGEPLQLSIAGWSESAIGASEPAYVKPVASAADAYYEVTIDQIRLIAEASDLRLVTSAARPYSFELWDAQRSAFAGFQAFVEFAGY